MLPGLAGLAADSWCRPVLAGAPRALAASGNMSRGELHVSHAIITDGSGDCAISLDLVVDLIACAALRSPGVALDDRVSWGPMPSIAQRNEDSLGTCTSAGEAAFGGAVARPDEQDALAPPICAASP